MATKHQTTRVRARLREGTWPVAGPRLRLVGASGTLPSPGRSDDGQPTIVGRVDGRALEIRVWRRRPNCSEAFRHPSGLWLALRFP